MKYGKLFHKKQLYHGFDHYNKITSTICSSTQLWWMKMRIGSVRLNIRLAPDRKCLICNVCDDTPANMMHCEGYPAETLQTMLGDTLLEENGLNWLFHPDRSDTVWSRTSRWIKVRWAYREKCFQERQAAMVVR